MNNSNKRKDTRKDDTKPKRMKKVCDYGERCYRRNPAHFREFSHPHLEGILDKYKGTGPYDIPEKYDMDSIAITEQLDVIVEKELYTPWVKNDAKSEMGKDVGSKDLKGLDGKFGNNSSSTSQMNAIQNLNLPSKQSTKSTTTQDNKRNSPTAEVGQRNSHSSQVGQRDSHLSQDSQKNSFTPQVGHRNSPNQQVGQNNSQTSPFGQRNSHSSQDSQKNSHTPQVGQRNTPNLQVGQNNSQTSQFGQRNSHSSQDSQKNSHTPQVGQRNTPNLQVGQNNSQTSQFGQRNSHSSQVGLRLSQNSTSETKNMDLMGNQRTPKVSKQYDSDYRPIVPPTRRVEDYLNVVVGKNKMAEKHAASAPYHIFYTTITSEKETHHQPYSITFQEILDRSLGELKCSLQINFMVEIAWLLAQYYFAGYSQKKLTILYGEECSDLKDISQKKPHVDAHLVQMATPFGKHHTKLMLLCYEDGSLRVVVSTANLYVDDWENRTQGLWFSPSCPELPPEAMPHDGESPTFFKRSLIRYLSHYHLPSLSFYLERVKRCDFSHINVFLVTSVPGSHFDTDWGMTRVGTLLRQHCCIPSTESSRWPLLAQASSIGSYGNKPNLWLTGDFLHHFTKIKDQPQVLSKPPELKLIYPSLENVKQSHDGLLGGGCLPYAASAHTKQPWLNDFLYQWRAKSTKRDRAMPHIKSYTRISPDSKQAAYFLLTSGNISKAAWGSINKGNAALRIMSYEAGVLFLPRFLINKDLFPLREDVKDRLMLPYDVPPAKYTQDMSPWVSDYLCG